MSITGRSVPLNSWFARASASAATGVAGSGAVLTVLAVLLVAGAPIATDDLWWHLKAGQMYATDGPWPAVDWMLHTAKPEAPIQHEWLFGVGLYGVDATLGPQALRIVHAALVLGALGLVGSLGWRQRLGVVPTFAVVVIFALLAAPRLAQLRPDLISIPATLLTVLILARPARGAGWVLGCVFVGFVLWSNAHSLVLIGINLAFAALLGYLLSWVLARWWLRDVTRCAPLPEIRWCLFVIVVAVVAAMLNPRGAAQLLTFLHSDAHSAMWHIADEWTRFIPFVPTASEANVSSGRWLAASLVVVGFAIAAGVGILGLVRAPGQARLGALDPVGLGLGAAGVVAMIASVRFAWLGVLPLIYVARALRPLNATVPGQLAFAAAALLGTWGLFHTYVVGNAWQRYHDDPRAYVEPPVRNHRYFDEGVRFLRASALQGNAYNAYWMGGYLGYWTAPRLKVFVDGRTEHYSTTTFLEYSSVEQMRGARMGESYLDVLDRTKVNVFFGVGFESWWQGVNTTAHLDGVPGWRLVSRSYRHAIYLRDDPAEQANWERVVAYYRALGVPFDEAYGLRPDAVVAARPDWAIANGMLPVNYAAMLATATELGHRDFRASRESLALVYALSGAFEHQIEMDEGTVAADVRSVNAARRLVYGYLILDDVPAARRHAKTLASWDAAGGREAATLIDAYEAVMGAGTDHPDWVRYRAVRRARLLVPAFPATAPETWPLEYRMCTRPTCDVP